MALPVALGLASREARRRQRVTLVGVACFIGVGLLFTLSRMSWIGAGAGILVTLLLVGGGRRARVLVMLVPILLVGMLVVSNIGGQSFGDRFSSIFNPRDQRHKTAAGDTERVQDWNAVLSIANEHPIIGVGFGDLIPALDQKLPWVTPAGQAQSTYLQVLGEAGALGAIALILLLGAQARVLRVALRRPSTRAAAAGLSGATVALLVEWTTDVTVRYSAVAASTAVLFGVAAGLYRQAVAAGGTLTWDGPGNSSGLAGNAGSAPIVPRRRGKDPIQSAAPGSGSGRPEAANEPLIICSKSPWHPPIRREHALAMAAAREGHPVSFLERPDDIRALAGAQSRSRWLRGGVRHDRVPTPGTVSVIPTSTWIPGHRGATAQQLEARRLNRDLQGFESLGESVVVATQPWQWPAVRNCGARRRVFDCADNWPMLIPGRREAFESLHRQIGAEADAVIAVSDALRDDFGPGLTVVPNGDRANACWRRLPAFHHETQSGWFTSAPCPSDLTFRSSSNAFSTLPPGWSLDLYGPCQYAGIGSAPSTELRRMLDLRERVRLARSHRAQ